jgi:hypothetical protein
MFEEKREAVTAIEMAVLPLLPSAGGFGSGDRGKQLPQSSKIRGVVGGRRNSLRRTSR